MLRHISFLFKLYIIAVCVYTLVGCYRPASRMVQNPASLNQPVPNITYTFPYTNGLLTPSLTPSSTPISDFPLTLGNTWIYSYTVYTENETTSWRVSDTVVATQAQDGYQVTEIQQDVVLTSGYSPPDIKYTPVSEKYWYLSDGSHYYRQNGRLIISQVNRSWLELVLPLSEGLCWYPGPDQRLQVSTTPPPASSRTYGCRIVTGSPAQFDTPAGEFSFCFRLMTPDGGGSSNITFCKGVGMVAENYDESDVRFGYHSILIGYMIQ